MALPREDLPAVPLYWPPNPLIAGFEHHSNQDRQSE
jgi:hypothetical protein